MHLIKGKCHTLQSGFTVNEIEIPKGSAIGLHSLQYKMFFHDPTFFLISNIEHTFPGLMVKEDRNDSYTRLYLSVTEYVDLIRKLNPCKDDPEYDFQLCVRNSLTRKLGCRVPWDLLSSEDFPVCSELDELRYFHGNYSCIAEYDLDEIMDKTDCLKPCTYKEYKLVGSERISVGQHGIFFRFADRQVVIEKEMTSYSVLSFLSDIGGSLGMFLGFSFLMVWDGVEAVLITIRQVWRQKKNEHTMIVP